MIKDKQRINFDEICFSDFDFIPELIIHKQSVEYGSFSGVAEMIGHQLILFKETGNQSNSIFSIDWEHTDQEILNLSQKILKQLDAPIFLGDNLKNLETIYGEADYVDDDTYINKTIYYYLNKENGLMYSFGIENSYGVTKVELVHNRIIMNERIDTISGK